MKRIGVLLAALAICAVAAIIIQSIGTVIYPGSMRWTAPVLCPSDQPDAFVVRYSQATSDGNSTNFTLFCMDDRGEFTEVGSWRPIAVMFAGLTGTLLGLVLLTGFVQLLRRSSGAGDSPTLAGTGSTTTDGSVRGIPDETRVEAQALINQGKLIHAIKRIRQDTDMGLKEAKEVAEALRDGHHVPSSRPGPLT